MLLIPIVLVSSILSIASGIGIDSWTSIGGSDPSLRAVDISAKGDQVWILGSDGALHFWSVDALTPDGDWQWIDESNGQRTTPYPIARIGATVDGCVWSVDQKYNIAIYNSSALKWKTITGAPNVTWISGLYCNSSFVVTNTPTGGAGNTLYYGLNNAWTEQWCANLLGPFACAGIVAAIGESNTRWHVNSQDIIYQWTPSSTYPWTQPNNQLAKQIDAATPSRVIILDPSGNMLLWNGGGWTGIPGGPAVKATISRSQAFYIDAAGNPYSANII